MKKALKAALPCTLPVMAGYLFCGFAFGVLFRQTGQHPLLATAMSMFVYAGSMQFFAIKFMDGSFDMLSIALLTLLINARHLFYGIPFVERFRRMGKRMPYMVFSLTDETFSLLCGAKAPEGVDSLQFMFWIALLDQCYWVAGTTLGALIGPVLPFDTKGIEFALTALFLVIFVEQWRGSPTKLPALAGLLLSTAALLVFGAKDFILPAMMMIAVALMALRRPVERKLEETKHEEVAESCQAQDTL